MHGALFVLLLGPLSAYAQIITISNPSASTPVSCNSTAEECSITVEGSASGDDEYHCPDSPECTKCVLECHEDFACYGAKLFSYQCETVNVTSAIGDNAMTSLDITGPINGSLFVIVNSSSADVFEGGIIRAPMTENVNVYIGDAVTGGSARSITVEGHYITGVLDMTCDGECQDSVIECPLNSVANGPSCIIDCAGDNDAGCQSMEIYTKNGISDVDLDCGSINNECQNTEIYCDLRTECTMQFATNTSSWSCQGGGCATYPSIIPSEQPTVIPSESSNPSDPSDTGFLDDMSSTAYFLNYTDDEQETTTAEPSDDDDTPFYEEKYFIPAAAGAAGVLIVILFIVVGCCCCKKTCSECCPCCCSQEEPDYTQARSQAMTYNTQV